MRLQYGVSLIEVLVTLVILQVGLLAMLAAQTFSLRQVQDALQRTQAVALTRGLFNDIQANPHLLPAIGTHLTLHADIPAAAKCGPNQPCTGTQLAGLQINSIINRLRPETGISLRQPALCLQQHSAGLELSVSWQQRTLKQAGPAGQCQPGSGRSAFAVPGGHGE